MFKSANENLLLNDALCNNFHGLIMNYDQGFFHFLAFKIEKLYMSIRSFDFLYVICIFTISLDKTGFTTGTLLLEVSLLKSEPIFTFLSQKSLQYRTVALRRIEVTLSYQEVWTRWC